MKKTSIFEKWIDNIQKEILKNNEASLFGHNTLKGDIKEEIIKQAIKKILPSIYEIGTGEIIDYTGRKSKQIDIIIARNDFPTYNGIGNSKIYLIESVLATIEVKSKLDKKDLFNSLNNCYSIIELVGNYRTNKQFIDELQKNYKSPNEGMIGERKQSLIRPASYIYAFDGYKRIKDFCENILKWAEEKSKINKLMMFQLPALITCDRLFATRNIAPYSDDNSQFILLAGKTENPFILFMFHLLYQLHKKIITLPDKLGVTPNMDIYIDSKPDIKFSASLFELKYAPKHRQ